jgi:hypothetical protein
MGHDFGFLLLLAVTIGLAAPFVPFAVSTGSSVHPVKDNRSSEGLR